MSKGKKSEAGTKRGKQDKKVVNTKAKNTRQSKAEGSRKSSGKVGRPSKQSDGKKSSGPSAKKAKDTRKSGIARRSKAIKK